MTENNDETVKQLAEVYAWIDEFSFSRVKRHISRDFSDGLFVAEILKTYYPTLVETHNYVSTQKRERKVENWRILQRKVFSKINFKITDEQINEIIDSAPNSIDLFLIKLKDFLT